MEGKFVKGLLVGGLVGAAMMKNKDMMINCRPMMERIKKELFQCGHDRQTIKQEEDGIAGYKRRPRKYVQARSHRIVRAGL